VAEAPAHATGSGITLVLGGGGARGLAHAGILEVLSNAGIPVRAIVGTSIGAEVGAFYCAGIPPNRIAAMVREFDWMATLKLFLPTLNGGGLTSGRNIMSFLRENLGETAFEDLLLGRVKRKHKDIIPDPVLLKSDGYPTYHLANVVDDHEMQITHILRAQEWVSSAPLHVLLYQAFGWEPPTYCHLPMVLGKDGQKLSKRHGATSVIEFRRQGYLPEALINYLARLGWSYDESTELFTREELERLFRIERLNKSPGAFDYKKLQWFNGVYIREKSDAGLRDLILPFLQEADLVSTPPTAEEQSILDGAMPLIKERLKLLSEAPDLMRFLLKDELEYDVKEAIPKKMDAQATLRMLREARTLLQDAAQRSDEENEETFRARAEELEVKLGSLLMPLRVAITGSRVSPPLFGSIRLLGEEKSLERVDKVIQLLEDEEEHG